MITMILLPILALYIALLIWAGRKIKRWPGRIAGLLVLLSPVIYWIGSYQYVQYRHEQDCAREGGLRVFIQPEKTDRIRLDMNSYGADDHAEFLLKNLYPKLVVVEAWDGKSTGDGRSGYFSYSIDAVTVALPKKDWKYIKKPLAEPTVGLYVLSESSQFKNEIEKTTTVLSRNGNTVASWTKFYHYWSRNGAMNIGWRCFYSGPQLKGAELLLSELISK